MRESKHEKVINVLAQYVVGKYPCPSGVIAQIIQETGWDLKTPKDINTGRESYNLGNIKGIGPAGSVTIWTTEFYNGKKTRVQAQFRAYRNYGESLDDHLSLLKKPRYVRSGVLKATTPRAYAEALQRSGYATDPRYADNIMRIVNAYNLTRFDQPVNPIEQLAKKAEVAVMEALEKWQIELADQALDNLAAKSGEDGKSIIQNATEWKEKLRKEPEKVLNDLTWLVFVLIDRATNYTQGEELRP